MTAIGETVIPSAIDRSPSRAWRKLKANKGALVGLAIIAFFAILAIAAPSFRFPIRTPQAGRRSARPRPPAIGLAPMTSAATFFPE